MEDQATTADGGVPECPECGRAMVNRTARRGPNAGRDFWGCMSYPRCKGIRPGAHGDTSRHSDSNTTGARGGSSLNSDFRPAQGRGSGGADPDAKRAETSDQEHNPRRRVDWSDATLRRSGWRAYYATVGASLRSIPDERLATLANCWVAREERPELRHGRRSEHDAAKRLVAATMRKILARGSAPPLHPDAERALLEAAGLAHRIVAMDGTGDVGPRLAAPPPLDEGDFALPADGEAVFDVGLTESPAESRFIEWANRQVPESVRWLIPQPSLDLLVAAEGTARTARAYPSRDRSGDSRCDFLFAPPGAHPAVIEVDGSQHTEQKSVDRHRDGRLAAVGVRTVRVTTRELTEDDGAGLRQVAAVLRAAPAAAGAVQPLVWAPIQVHRLVLGLCEAIEGGYLNGDRWTVEVHDPTGLAADLVGPYLELLDALDRMWGGRNVAPAEAVLAGSGRTRTYRRTSDGAYCAGAPGALGQQPDTRIILDCDRTSSEVLPESDAVPTVVIRSTGLRTLMRDSAHGPMQRPEPFVSCDSTQGRSGGGPARRVRQGAAAGGPAGGDHGGSGWPRLHGAAAHRRRQEHDLPARRPLPAREDPRGRSARGVDPRPDRGPPQTRHRPRRGNIEQGRQGWAGRPLTPTSPSSCPSGSSASSSATN